MDSTLTSSDLRAFAMLTSDLLGPVCALIVGAFADLGTMIRARAAV